MLSFSARMPCPAGCDSKYDIPKPQASMARAEEKLELLACFPGIHGIKIRQSVWWGKQIGVMPHALRLKRPIDTNNPSPGYSACGPGKKSPRALRRICNLYTPFEPFNPNVHGRWGRGDDGRRPRWSRHEAAKDHSTSNNTFAISKADSVEAVCTIPSEHFSS